MKQQDDTGDHRPCKRIDLFGDEADSMEASFVQNKFSIEDDSQFLELARRLEKYINANPTLISPRKRQLESQFVKPQTVGAMFRRVDRKASMASPTSSANTEFPDEVIEKVLQIYREKPFHDRKRLLPAAMVFMKKLVPRIPFFEPFSQEVVEALLHGSTAIAMPEGKIVYGEDEVVGHMFVVLKGRVEIFKRDIDLSIKTHRFEIGDSQANKVMPLLMGDGSSLVTGATSNYVGLLNFGLDASKVKKILVCLHHSASARSGTWIQFRRRKIFHHAGHGKHILRIAGGLHP